MEILAKAVVWSLWGLHAAISIVYIAIAIVTAENIDRVNFLGGVSADLFKSGLMASVVMGIIVVIIFIAMSPVVMLGRVFGKAMSMAYGVMLGISFQASLFMLLAGLVLHASEDLAGNLQSSNIWSKSDYDTYVATFSFSYILTGTFMILCFTLFFMRNKLSRDQDYKPNAGSTKPGVGSASTTDPAGQQEPTWPPTNPAPAGGGGNSWAATAGGGGAWGGASKRDIDEV
mmetsp:Transcript_26517/g.78758  ORF Transcript_26517/g.78758 Transcript_26517/m.78758 type:complete len:230 (-) Transcript_26517:458-1147(-)